jgi:hypothetical protein
MKKRLLGAGAVVILLVGVWLGNFFKGFGLGGGSGDGEGAGDPARTHVNVAAESSSVQPAETQTPPAAPNEAASPNEVLTVLVAGDQYRIQEGADAEATFEPATVQEIADRAGALPGDRHGVPAMRRAVRRAIFTRRCRRRGWSARRSLRAADSWSEIRAGRRLRSCE